MKISILITSFKEPNTIGKAIEAFLSQGIKDYELIVSAPDEETLNVVKSYTRVNSKVRFVKDKGEGKPSALNNLFKVAKGKILVLSDGDVFVSRNSLNKLIKPFKDKNIGAVTARVIPSNKRTSLFGFWSFLLAEGFHKSRLINSKKQENVICSGYYYAIKANIIKKIPKDVLADDAFISLKINSLGYKSVYEPNAEVYVKYPNNLPDWIRQKKRTAARFYQLRDYFKISKIHSFLDEVLIGVRVITELKSIKEFFYLVLLAVMKFYIWFRVLLDFRLWKRSFKKTWQRVESTK